MIRPFALAAFALVFSTISLQAQENLLPAQTAAQDAAAKGVGVANPSVGFGVNGISDWTVEQPFIDVMKTARPWVGHLPGQFGGFESKQLAAGGYLDENGWVKSVPKQVNAVSTLILTDLPEEATSVNGRYRLTYRGQGAIRLEGNARNVELDGNAIWFDFVAGPGNLLITISKSDPEGTGDYIRDIEVVKEENIPLHEVGAIFNPDWIERIQDLRLLRFMDWMNTNDSTLSEWSQHPKVNNMTYAGTGAPAEVMVALANQIGADPWFTLPHMATDEYMRRFAEVVRDNLDPNLKAHVEFSNEVWNWQFQQAQWAEAEAKKRWGQESKGVEFYGMRAAQMAQIWDDVFGDQADDRLVKVISTQTGWLGLEAPILTTPLWVAEDPARNRPAAEYFDAYAITGYFSGGLGHDQKAPTVKKWIQESRGAARAEARRQNLTGAARAAYVRQHAYDKVVSLAAKELRDGSLTGDKLDTLNELIERIFPYQFDVAQKYGLKLVMYEGGTHVAAFGAWVDDPELTPFFMHFNYTPEMGEMYKTLLEGWKSVGGTVFNQFVDVSAPSKWGSWGALRHLKDQNPRFDALAAFNADTPAWWETREPDTFLQGVTKIAAAGDDRLQGTVKMDILIGGDGDDQLIGAGGSDRLHGGAGNDEAILPGRLSDYSFRREGELLTATAGRAITAIFAVETLLFADEPDKHVATSEIR
jgi:hypothetical protein